MTSSPETVTAWAPQDLVRFASESAHVVVPDGPWRPLILDEATRPAVSRSEGDVGYDRGFEDGRRGGLAEARAEMAPALEMLAQVLESLAASQTGLVRDRQRDLEALSLAVARKLVEREVALDPATLHDLIARALALLPLDLTLEIRVNPADLAAMSNDAAVLPVSPGVTIHWVGDAELPRGSFVIESPQRIVDGRTDVALRALYEKLGHE